MDPLYSYSVGISRQFPQSFLLLPSLRISCCNPQRLTLRSCDPSKKLLKKVKWYSNRHNNLTDNIRMAENKASTEQDGCWKADKKLVQANPKITELEAKLTELQQELAVLQTQDKRTPTAWNNPYDFSGSDLEPTSGRSSWKCKKGQAFPQAISYGGFFPSKASTLVLADEQMPMMPASSLQAVGSQTTLPLVSPPTSRITPPWGKVDPQILVTGVLPRLLGKS